MELNTPRVSLVPHPKVVEEVVYVSWYNQALERVTVASTRLQLSRWQRCSVDAFSVDES